MVIKLQHLTHNTNGVVRKDTMEGRSYTVVPMVMLTEGVHSGSDGPLYYPAEELAKTPFIWNHKPVVVYHPEIDGKGVSACDPVIMTKHKIGVIMNTVFEPASEGKLARLKAEAWLEEDRIAAVDARVSLAIANNNMLEVSTGVIVDAVDTEGDFTFNQETEHYTKIAVNYRPDHLAVLPDQKGACSISDGAGLLRNAASDNGKETNVLKHILNRLFGKNTTQNEASHESIRAQLHGVVRSKFESDNTFPWVEDVFDNYFIYEVDGTLFRLAYNIDESGVVTVEGEPEKVVRETGYKVVGNVINKGDSMNRKDAVQALISNKELTWNEEDREWLEGLEDGQFAKITGNKVAPVVIEKKEEPAPVIVNTNPVVKTLDEWLAEAPAEISASLRSQLATNKTQRQTLIDQIIANVNNTFTKEQLASQTTESLSMIANLAKAPAQAIYAPQAGVMTENYDAADVDAEPLVMPTMNFNA